VNFPNKFLRHKDFRLLLEEPAPGEDIFNDDSTFFLEFGRASIPGDRFVSFRSVNFPTRWIRHKDFHVFIDDADDDQAKKDATFLFDKVAA